MYNVKKSSIAAFVVVTLAAAACASDDDAATSEPVTTEAVETTLTVPEPTSTDEPTPVETSPPSTDAEVEPATGEPIVIGTLVIESGGLDVTGNYQALSAFMAEYNARGGYNGRPVEVIKVDSGADPASNAAAGSELVERQNVLAMVGGSAFLDCIANGALYESSGVPVINVPLDGFCATNQQVFPLGVGSDTAVLPAIQWMIEDQGASTVAYVALDIPQSRTGGDLISKTAASLGAELVIAEYAPFGGNPDIEGIAGRIAQADPDAIMLGLNEPLTEALIQALATQGISPSETTMVVSPGLYTKAFVDLVGEAGEGLYLVDSFPLLDSGDEQTDEMLAALDEHVEDPTPDVFEQFGWISGQVFVAALEALDGADPTRENVTAALRTLVIEPGGTLWPATLDFTMFPIVIDVVPGYIARLADGEFRELDGSLILAPVPAAG